MAWGPSSLQALRGAKAETEKQERAERKERRRRVEGEQSSVGETEGPEATCAMRAAAEREWGYSSPLPYGATEKGQDPLEVPVRRGEQDLSLLQIPTFYCQPPTSLHPKMEPGRTDKSGGAGGKRRGGDLRVPCKFVHWNIYVCVHIWCVCMMSQ